ncbi:MAG TPA: hypothetical protein VGI16_06315 [Candidatus Acidoferrum sp.]
MASAPSHDLVYWSWLALDFSPAVPFTYAWILIIQLKDRSYLWFTAPLCIGTMSLGWLALALAIPKAMGSDYSDDRYAIIEFNFFAALVAASLAALIMRRARIPTVVGCLLLCLVWAFIAAINSVV